MGLAILNLEVFEKNLPYINSFISLKDLKDYSANDKNVLFN